MAARFAHQHHSATRYTSAAAACTSAPIIDIMDTAMILVVSILILGIRLCGS